jgi:hypothetical protein
MTSIREVLVRGSEKVISHYQFLLDTAKSETERMHFRQRIEEERRLLQQLSTPEQHPARAA